MIFPTDVRFFRPTLSVHARFLLYVSLALITLIADQRYHLFDALRRPLNSVVYSVKLTAHESRYFFEEGHALFIDRIRLHQDNKQLRNQILVLKARLWALEAKNREWVTLKKILALSDLNSISRTCVGRLYGWQDPSKYELIFDKGSNSHIQSGQPVVDESGLLGQIATVYPTMAEIKLIVDKGQMTPVMVERTGERAILYGNGGGLSLHYWSLQSDVKPHDRLVTSGIDGVYPAGLPVATVQSASKKRGAHFATLVVNPLAGIGRSRYGLVLNAHSKWSFSLPALDTQPTNDVMPQDLPGTIVLTNG